ncbi:MAG: glutamine--fructose-6-phosphate transaminase (isomerizing) [Fimbriimonadaceae bacterium]|nr:glutamine--fructose-6-phosphate transaminase (isomerizing) [Alphaproteobacteria bacterium]
MCGIIGIIGNQPVATSIVDGLRRLEYRGYDSAGVATIETGDLTRLRAKGKLGNLQKKLDEHPLSGTIGIGHTRWATHGAPTETNAHPHSTSRVAVVHNGIIENFLELKNALKNDGVVFESETDTEVVAHLITGELDKGLSPKLAVQNTLARLEGAFAFVIMFHGETELLIGARNGPPLAIGIGNNEMYFGSDAIALAPFTDQVVYLDDGDWAVITKNTAEIFDSKGNKVERAIHKSIASSLMVDKGNHRHFMAKEIHEQPEVVGHTIAHYVDLTKREVVIPEVMPFDFAALDRITISACGTAYYAGLVAKYWFEQIARIPVEIDVASEFRYREAPLPENGLALVISQSGETADTLATLRYCAKQGQHIASIVNVRESSIARESGLVLPILAGPEIGVASTKAFTCQLVVLAALAIAAAKARGVLSAAREQELVAHLIEIPRLMVSVLKSEPLIEQIAGDLMRARDVLFLGRGANYPIALEGALKLKEISYIHAEGYAAGQLKHGPIALIDENVQVIAIAPKDALYEKTVSNIEEVAARGGKIILITDETGAKDLSFNVMAKIVIPDADPFIYPVLFSLPVQMLAYHTAVKLGTDVDQPRNLAKSVTVE